MTQPPPNASQSSNRSYSSSFSCSSSVFRAFSITRTRTTTRTRAVLHFPNTLLGIGQGFPFSFTIQQSAMRHSHQDIDLRNQLQDGLLASRLRRDTGLLRRARANLRRWKARDGSHPRAVFVEWERILEHLSAREIADFLVSDTPMARRLRQSSPFLGLFPERAALGRRK